MHARLCCLWFWIILLASIWENYLVIFGNEKSHFWVVIDLACQSLATLYKWGSNMYFPPYVWYYPHRPKVNKVFDEALNSWEIFYKFPSISLKWLRMSLLFYIFWFFFSRFTLRVCLVIVIQEWVSKIVFLRLCLLVEFGVEMGSSFVSLLTVGDQS